jgi:hypothetical protein
MSSKNIYALLSNLDVNSTNSVPPADEQDPEHAIVHTTFDLVALEESRPGPVFTRELLQQIAAYIKIINVEQTKPLSERSVEYLEHIRDDGKAVVVWKPAASENANSVSIEYMTRVELHPLFTSLFGDTWHRHIDQSALNPHLPPPQVLAPYYISSYARAPPLPLDQTLLNRVLATQTLWLASPSCTRLRIIITSALSKLSVPITQIVGIGLGAFAVHPAFYAGSALQHIAVVYLAGVIDAYNAMHYPHAAGVKVVLGDPCYEDADVQIVSALANMDAGADLEIEMGLSDPDVLLSVDAQTMVVSAYLPTKVPLMQILADLFGSGRDDGPGILMMDKLHPPTSRKYCLRNRSAPHVERWLDNSYIPWTGKFVSVGTDVERDVGLGPENKYWVESMGIWVRKDI